MICEKCGQNVKENSKFCLKCGAKINISMQSEKLLLEKKKLEKKAKQPKPQKRHIKFFLFLLSFFSFLGILLGMWSASYVARNGWESIPFAKNIASLPFVTFDKENIESYSDQIDTSWAEESEKNGSEANSKK